MEKLKNLLNPGHDKDNEALYGSGSSSGQGLKGEGSHFQDARDASNTTGNTHTATGQGHSTDMPGGFPSSSDEYSSGDAHNPYSGNVDSRVGGTAQPTSTGVGISDAGSTAAGGQSSTLGSGSAQPRSAMDLDSSNTGSTHPTSAGTQSSTLGSSIDPQRDTLTSGTQPTSGIAQTSDPSHHLGRDAAALGTAGAVGEGIHHRRENEVDLAPTTASGTGATSTSPTGTSNAPSSAASGAGAGNTNTNTLSGINVGNATSSATPAMAGSNLTGSQPAEPGHQSGHHYGRDAAAVGTAGAVAEGVHHHHEHEPNTATTTSTAAPGTSAYHTAPTGTAVANQHTTFTANRLDPSINRDAPPMPSAKTHDQKTGGGAESADVAHSPNSKSGSKSGSHLGRDAAVGAGVGAAGLAEHEHRKDAGISSTNPAAYGADNSMAGSSDFTGRQYGDDARVAGTGPGAPDDHKGHYNQGGAGSGTTSAATAAGAESAPNTAGPHPKDWMNKLDPRVTSDPNAVATGPTGSHATTDSAEYSDTVGMRNRNAYSGADTKSATGFGGRDDPAGQNIEQQSQGTHHYGRDAAIGGAGAAGLYEADKHHHHGQESKAEKQEEKRELKEEEKERKSEEKEAKREHKAEIKEHKQHEKELAHHEKEQHKAQEKEAKHLEKEREKEAKQLEKEQHHKKSGGLFSFLHRDKSKKYTKEEEDEFDRQEKEHNSNKFRDAALGGAAGAGLGAGAYEAEKHHGSHHGDSGMGSAQGTQSTLPDRTVGSHTGTTGDHASHHGRDAAVVGGVGGAGALAAHEHGLHHSHGDVAGSTSSQPSHLGRDTAGVGAVGGAEHNNNFSTYPTASGDVTAEKGHYRDSTYHAGETGLGSTLSGSGDSTYHAGETGLGSSILSSENTHQQGTSALAGLTGEAQHEDHKRSFPLTGTSHSADTNNYDNTYDPFSTAGEQSAVGGVPHAVHGEHEIGSSSHTHNKLHKDPPASHPAAQGGVAADGQQIESGTGRTLGDL